MNTGTLIKDGKTWKVNSASLKNGEMSVLSNLGLTDDLHGREIEFDNSGGPIHVIIYDGKEYKRQNAPAQVTPKQRNWEKKQGGQYNMSSDADKQYDKREQRNAPAVHVSAPYNFIALPANPLPMEEEIPGHDRYAEGKLSGYIDLQITAHTPLFIRGDHESFLCPSGDYYVLPGSSLRGMTRSLMEIAAWSNFRPGEQFENKRLYFRAVADRKSILKTDYDAELKDEQEAVEAGYLTFDSKTRKYSIQTASYFELPQARLRKFQYLRQSDGSYEVHSGMMPNKKRNWIVGPPDKDGEKLDVESQLIDDYEQDVTRDIEWDILEFARTKKNGNVRFEQGVPVFFRRSNGSITSFGHTRYYRIPYKDCIADHVPAVFKNGAEDIVESLFGYARENKQRAGRLWFEDGRTPKNEVKTKLVVLKLLSTPKPTTFQHYLKQPYGKNTTLKELNHWGKNCDIRGVKRYWHKPSAAGNQGLWKATDFKLDKVGLDKYIQKIDNQKKAFEPAAASFDAHIDSNGKWKYKISGDFENLTPQQVDLITRFFSLDHLKAKKYDISKPMYTLARVADVDTTFRSRIRFDNLSKIELGALLFVLNLPEDCRHKLGMGKPLGLGSVRILPSLTIIERKERYADVFDAKGQWNTGARPENDLDQFLNAFAASIGERLGNPDINSADDYWKNDKRMKELNVMLRFDQGLRSEDWEKRTRYMELPEFKPRPVLPEPSEVVM